MTTATTVSFTGIGALHPNALELKAIERFASTDETRPHLCNVWIYETDLGCTYMASDGHVIVVRNTDTHIGLDVCTVARVRALRPTSCIPPRWGQLVKAPNCEGPNVARRGINPAYFAMVAEVERAAGKRLAADYVPAAGDSKKTQAYEKRRLADKPCSVWSIGCDPMDGWYWSFDTGTVRWEGVVMPRRI
jgi:hypothetical protein